MIFSHQYKYIFLEIPLTASWAVALELCELYGAEEILHKHASYYEFLQIASDAEKQYHCFAAVRHPLDKIVSRYYKLLSDHKGSFSDPNSIDELIVDYSDLKKFRCIMNENIDFSAYFHKFYKLPYSDMIDLSAKYIDLSLIHI